LSPEDPVVHTPHLDLRYESELRAVTARVQQMCDLAERMVRDAVLALLSRDEAVARQVIAADRELDLLELECDRLCVELLARRSPVGSDLRMVTATLKLVADVERIGDLAVNIVKRMHQAGDLQLPDEVTALARSAIDEVSHAFDCLRRRDAKAAREMYVQDHVTDAHNRAAFDRLLHLASASPGAFDRVLALTNTCRHLERIGDHAVNVAEAVVYMVDGAVLRHAGPKD
jgi:phosphate transport system protein